MHLNAKGRRDAGFSMIEVLVTIVVLSIGFLGLAKMQAAALSNTQVSRVRSLIALQAGSLAAVMHGNRDFWAAGLAPSQITASGTTVTDATNVLSTVSRNCASLTCNAAQLAAYDLDKWVRSVNASFPTYNAQVNCSTSPSAPVSCRIKMTWSEKYVAVNTSTASASSVMTADQTFTLYVEP